MIRNDDGALDDVEYDDALDDVDCDAASVCHVSNDV